MTQPDKAGEGGVRSWNFPLSRWMLSPTRPLTSQGILTPGQPVLVRQCLRHWYDLTQENGERGCVILESSTIETDACTNPPSHQSRYNDTRPTSLSASMLKSLVWLNPTKQGKGVCDPGIFRCWDGCCHHPPSHQSRYIDTRPTSLSASMLKSLVRLNLIKGGKGGVRSRNFPLSRWMLHHPPSHQSRYIDTRPTSPSAYPSRVKIISMFKSLVLLNPTKPGEGGVRSRNLPLLRWMLSPPALSPVKIYWHQANQS